MTRKQGNQLSPLSLSPQEVITVQKLTTQSAVLSYGNIKNPSCSAVTGMLKDKLRILVTHSLHFLNTADKIIVLNEVTF